MSRPLAFQAVVVSCGQPVVPAIAQPTLAMGSCDENCAVLSTVPARENDAASNPDSSSLVSLWASGGVTTV